jgi:hypothetical protein
MGERGRVTVAYRTSKDLAASPNPEGGAAANHIRETRLGV